MSNTLRNKVRKLTGELARTRAMLKKSRTNADLWRELATQRDIDKLRAIEERDTARNGWQLVTRRLEIARRHPVAARACSAC